MSKMSEVVEAVSSALSPSLSSVARLVIVFGQLSDDTRTELLLRKRLVEDLTSSWNASLSLCDVNKELKSFVTTSPIKNVTPTGEETWVYQSSALHTEILVNFGVNPVNDKLTGLRSDGNGSPFTLVVYVGMTLPPTGLWLLRDGPYLPNACGISLSGPCPTAFEISGRPGIESTLDRKGINEFCGRLLEIVRIARMVKDPELRPSSCAPQFYDRPTMYIFPSGQGTSAFFGMADFSLLADAGYGGNPVCWDLVRRRERLDVLLVTHLGIHNLFGMKSMLEKTKAMKESSRPKIGHAFLNCWRQTKGNSVAAKKDLIADKGVNVCPDSCNQTTLNWRKEAMSIVRDLEQLKINPQPCVSHGIETHACLYHKVGVGSACIEVLWPNNDERLKQFLETWKDESTDVDFMDRIPAWDSFSVCAVLNWIPAQQGKRVRVLLTGGAPESVVFAGLEKLKRKEKQGTPLDSRTCLCKDSYKDSHAVHETAKKHEGPKKGYNGGRIQSKEKHVVAKDSASKENGAVKSGPTVSAQREVKQHAKPPSGVFCGKSGEAKRRVGPRGRSGFKMEAGQAKGVDAKVETLRGAERSDLDECVGSKRGDALQKANKVERADHAPKNAEQQITENTTYKSMKRANKAQKAAKGSGGQMKKSWNVSAIEEAKKDVGKSIDHHASGEIKEDVGKSSDVCASGETKALVKSNDVHASEEKADVGKSNDVHASGETKALVKSKDDCASEEIKADVGKSSDVYANEETKEDVGKSSDVCASGETKQDVGKSSDVHASGEIKADVGKSNDVHASEEIKDVGKSSDVCVSEGIKEDVGKSNDVHASEETKDIGKSSCANAETKEDFSKSSDAFVSKETNEDTGKSSDVHASEETQESVGKSGDSLESNEGKEDLVTGTVAGSVDPTSCESHTLTKDELCKMEEEHRPLEEDKQSKGSQGEQIVEQAKEAAGLELGSCPEKAKELTESDLELPYIKEEAQVPFVHEEIALPPEEIELSPKEIELPPKEIELSPKEIELSPKEIELSPKDVELPPKEIELPLKEVELQPKEIELQPKEIELPPKEIELPPKEIELPLKEIELPPKEVELPPKEVELPPREIELPPKEIELPPKEIELPPKEIELPPNNIQLPLVETDAVVSCGAIEAAGPSSEKDMNVLAAAKEDQDVPPAKYEVVLPSEESATKDDVDIPPAEEGVVSPSKLPVTMEDQGVPPVKDAVVTPLEVVATKEDLDGAVEAVRPLEDEVVPPSDVPATKEDLDIPPAEGEVVPPSKVPTTKENQDVPPAKDAVVSPFEVVVTKEDLDVAIEAAGPSENEVVPPSEVPATKEDLDVPHAEGEMVPPSELSATTEHRDVLPSEDDVVQPSKVSSTKEDMDLPAGEKRVVPPPELPAMKGDRDEPSEEDVVVPPSEMPAPSKVSTTKEDMEVPAAEKEVVPPSEWKVTKSPKKGKPTTSASERRKVPSEAQTLSGKLHKTPAGAYDLDRADSLDDLPSISKSDQLSDYIHCSAATHTLSSTATAHDPDFNVEILWGRSGNDFPAMNQFQGVDYKEDIFTAPRSLAGDCDLHFSIERKASSSSDVELDSLDGDGESFDPGQTWEPMNLPEPEPPKHLSDAKVGDEPKEQRKKTNVRNSRKPCPDDVDKNRKSKPARETRANNNKSKGVIAHSTSSDKITTQKSTKVEATHSGLSEPPGPVPPESKISEPKMFTRHNRPTNVEPVYFTVAFIPGRGEPQYVSKLFFQKVRARYYVLSSVSHELSVLDSLLEAKEEWEEEQGVKFPVSVIPTHGSKALEEWVARRSEKLSRLNVDVRKAADECKVCFGVADEEDAFDAFQLDL